MGSANATGTNLVFGRHNRPPPALVTRRTPVEIDIDTMIATAVIVAALGTSLLINHPEILIVVPP
jgi:hypothetical protein